MRRLEMSDAFALVLRRHRERKASSQNEEREVLFAPHPGTRRIALERC
jgi:hypothetical protein